MIWALALVAALAQDPSARWRTAETEHFRVHYPEPAEAWALETASRLEAIRARVVEEVGFDPPGVVDVVVEDPLALSNGSYQSFGFQRQLRFWTTPPPPDSVIGHYRSWSEDLAVHELAHLVHLSRPTRHPGLAALSTVLGTDGLALTVPRWAAEGYATVVEARLTGFGRPNGDGRAAVLRALASAGRMPSYGELNASGRFLGGAYAYLVGSAFLEWLELRYGDGALRDLWAAMTARRGRGLSAAFRHVFAEAPEALYARFVAELVHHTLTLEAALGATDDTLWHELAGGASGLAVSPDGARLALVRGGETPRLEVWPTAPDAAPAEAFSAAGDALLEADPGDARPRPPRTFPVEPEAVRKRPGIIGRPVWVDDHHLVLPSWRTTANGDLRPELVVWSADTGRERVLTRGAWLTDPAALPGGDLVAVRTAWGATQLVRVDGHTGAWTAITAPSVTEVVAQPSVDPDGARVAFVRNAGGWRLVVRSLADGAERVLDTPERAGVSHPAWGPDGALYASVGSGGFVEIWRFDVEAGTAAPVTRTLTAAVEPAPLGDGLLYLVLDDDGVDVHRVDGVTPQAPVVLPTVPAPAVPPTAVPVPLPEAGEVVTHPYRRSAPSVGGVASASAGPGRGVAELGLVVTDLLPRWTVAVKGGIGPRGLQGGATSVVWRGAPVRLELRVFGVMWERSRDWRLGGSLELDWRRRWQGSALSVHAGVWGDGALSGGDAPSVGGVVDLGVAGLGWLGASSAATGRLSAGAEVGATGARPWSRVRAAASGELGPRGASLIGRYEVGATVLGGPEDAFELGSLGSGLVPEAWLRGRVISEWAEPGEASGLYRDRVRGGLLFGGVVESFFQRDRLWGVTGDGDGLAPGSTSMFGWALTSAHRGGVPLPWTERADVEAGVACRVEHGRYGWREQACRYGDHWAWWLRVSMRL